MSHEFGKPWPKGLNAEETLNGVAVPGDWASTSLRLKCNHTPWYLPKYTENVHRKTCTCLFVAAFSRTAKLGSNQDVLQEVHE